MNELSHSPSGGASKALQTAAGDLEAFGNAHEHLHEALIEAVKAAGGSKAVAIALWGSAAGVDVVQRKLLACLNPERAEKLSLDEVLAVMRLGRQHGCHAPMQFLSRALSYAEPQPIQPRDEADELRRQFIESTRALAAMAARIEGLDRQQAQLRVAA